MPDETQTPETALISQPIQAAMDKALNEVQIFIESDAVRDKMLHVLTMQVSRNGELQRCTPASFGLAIYRMFELGLDPCGINEAWLVPFKGQATLIPGYGGVRKIALGSPDIADIVTDKVCEHDAYEIDIYTGQPLHSYPPRFKPRGRIEGYYAAARLKSERWITVQMSVEDVRRHRDTYSQAAKKTIWQENRGEDGLRPSSFDGMAMKTCLRMLCHPRNMTMSPSAQEVLGNEQALYALPHGYEAAGGGLTGKVPTEDQHRANVVDLYGDPPPRDNGAPQVEVDTAQAWTGDMLMEVGAALRDACQVAGVTRADMWQRLQDETGAKTLRDIAPARMMQVIRDLQQTASSELCAAQAGQKDEAAEEPPATDEMPEIAVSAPDDITL